MLTSRINVAGLLGVFVFALGGCSKSENKSAPPAPLTAGIPAATTNDTTAELQTVARLHWLGRKLISADTTASNLNAILNLPESTNLADNALDKLSLAPWGLQRGATTPTNVPSSALRGLLGDVLQAECFLEIRGRTNRLGELALGCHLGNDRALVWQTNLATVFESLTGQQPALTSEGWTIIQTHWPERIELTRAGEWTIFGLSGATNGSLGAMTLHLQNMKPSSLTDWLEAEFDAQGVAGSLGLKWVLPTNWPHLSLALSSRGGAVHTRLGLSFPHSLGLELPGWNIPTNLIHEPLVAFTAVRGLTKWLESLPAWNGLPIGPAPTQLYTWALNGVPLQTYLAIPTPDASNRVALLSASLLERSREYFETNSFGKLEYRTNGTLLWGEFPFLPVSVEATRQPVGDFILAGWSQGLRTNRHTPPDLVAQVTSRTNLVYYDWEITEPRVEAWTYLGQTVRLVAHLAQLPAGGVSMNWLKAAAPKLKNCVTAGFLTETNEITITRVSSVGLTGLELHLLADWLESPVFPSGLYSLNTEPDPRLYLTHPPRSSGDGAVPGPGTLPPAHR